jgi:hypothetical protein
MPSLSYRAQYIYRIQKSNVSPGLPFAGSPQPLPVALRRGVRLAAERF